MPEEESYTGVLERIIFSNEENQFLIGELRADSKSAPITITGILPGVQCGETLNIHGQWVINQQYGQQFKVARFKSELPATVHGIRRYLGSGLVPGIGKVYANKIVDAFGKDTLKVISEESARLREVPGIGKARAQSIKAAWEEQHAVREIMVFLQTYGVSSAQCVRLVKQYGNEARTVLKEEPYRVARDIDGIGFKTADKIALNLGFANDAPPRMDAGILFALEELESEGHTCIPITQLVDTAVELLQSPRDKIEARIPNLVEADELKSIEDDHLLQLPRSFRAETQIADSLSHNLSQPASLPPIKIDAAIQWAQDKAHFEFAPEQAEAIRMALSEKVSIITGGPGTGKTSILRALVSILSAKKVKILLAAPTGRAAQRMAETTRGYAQTIHRLLKFEPAKGRFTHNEDNPLKADFVIVDETSMLDARLAAALLRAIPLKAHILLVGDVNQLPSVGAGNVLTDLIDCKQIAVTRLHQVFRQQKESSIITTAYNVLSGSKGCPYTVESLKELGPQYDLQFIKAIDPESCLAAVKYLCERFIPGSLRKNAVKDAQILAPMHRGVAGIGNINIVLQEALNPDGRTMVIGAQKYRVGDKIIQNRNNYDKNIFNGDIGFIQSMNGETGTLEVQFDSELVELARADLMDVSLAYSISVHKSQGSEYPIVIIPLLKQHFMMLQRNLLYTALTRGKRKVFIVGDPSAWFMAVNNADPAKRFTHLKEKLLSRLN